ncbi:hypothetical protein [Xanthomonas campestris]|uniref:hypothetical protein n=2 Tax=Xanthomonas campestris TaxID=339 RepID=UPI00094B482E|nr:hypothetical protein [Xanthomonas campestris]MCF8824840.1 hypothetical protein [Xanthomonas campestris pv. raphani]MDM7586876.1 hypothetical protein [Xanthomonas campestris]MDM7594030.1 hypothetical protein [Xanthomonas campestris]MEA9561855.1 hypothetical protein [Xanthomonas campestris]MEA9724517.1 hypothetical protein [Xanthomonas campestris]
MGKKLRIARPKGELERELREQIELLQHACASFDSGLEAIGKHIALSLRVLLHHRGNSQALLEQLALRNGYFYDSAGAINPRNLLTECNLVMFQLGPDGARYLPLVAAGGPPSAPKLVPFAEWWNEPVLKDNKGRFLSRRELVGNVADTDGGAHVDPELEEAYMDLSRNNSLGWVFQGNDIVEPLKGRPELGCMRQIAHEVLLTLKRRHPKAFGAEVTA